ncbi:MAG: plastocyanin/azurin family copper-binding protein, partial [Saprospiraceae bacterium]
GIHGAGFVYDISLTNTGDHPYYCIPHGGPGGIGQSGVIHAVDDCENGLVQVAVSFSVTSGSAGGYNVFVDGEPYPGGPFAYDDPTGQNLLFLQIAGDGTIHTITVQDTETSFCAATTQITLPECNAGCEITGLSVEFPTPVTHTVEVKDFEFVPKTLMINLGDTIEFQWTGAIAHTTTSDATSGSDSWDSGLSGNGATWTLVLENAGLHPYYCIPHGGPGGIGMAGTILVKNNGCQDGQITADLSFQSSNTGTGYNLYVDDALQVGSPFEYNSSDSTTTLATQLPGDGGSHTLIVADADDAACADTLVVPVPNCDSDCSIGLVVNQEGDCDAGGQVPFAVTVESSNAGSSFHLEIDGNPWPGSPFNYAPSGVTVVSISLPGDGGAHTVEVVDADSASCGDFIDVTTADCSPDCSLSILLAQTGGCDSSGEVPYDLSVQITNAGAGFDLMVDGVLQPGSPFDYTGPTTVLAVGLTGDGQPHVLIVSDSGDISCADMLAVQVPDCGVACELKNLQIDIDVPMVHTVEVLDFEFFPKDIFIATGDTVRFVWTGVVPHTSTSDATTGADTWNSGLF